MKRRQFIKTAAKAAAITPILINGLPMRALSQSELSANSLIDLGENILVLIQLHGGNDGLNTLVPIQQYGTYNSLRSNIAIPNSGSRKYINLDSTLAAADQVGLHPDMTNMKAMYDSGLVNIVQGVGYSNTNFSHFRSRDIWFMGGDYDQYKSSGWMGRYLDHIYPDYPDAYPTTEMPDPLGLEIGLSVSLGYYRDLGIPTAIATSDPGTFSDVISSLGGPNPTVIPDDHYGMELQYIMDLFANANDYATQLQNRYNAGTNHVTYPGTGAGTGYMPYTGAAPGYLLKNELGPQLQTIARLIQGGSKTKIYLVRLNNFDTHNAQVQTGDPTHGAHGALLYHLSNAVKAFFDDLAISGMDEKVLAMTFTDFGRRPESNGSLGTDHGTTSPTFVFGKYVQPGIIGTNPSLTSFDDTGNLLVQNDYRQVITSVLCDWLGADMTTLQAVELDSFASGKLGIISGIENPSFTHSGIEIKVYPNPIKDVANIEIKSTESVQVQLKLTDVNGTELWQKESYLFGGTNYINQDLSQLSTGFYLLNIYHNDSQLHKTIKLVKQ